MVRNYKYIFLMDSKITRAHYHYFLSYISQQLINFLRVSLYLNYLWHNMFRYFICWFWDPTQLFRKRVESLGKYLKPKRDIACVTGCKENWIKCHLISINESPSVGCERLHLRYNLQCHCLSAIWLNREEWVYRETERFKIIWQVHVNRDWVLDNSWKLRKCRQRTNHLYDCM